MRYRVTFSLLAFILFGLPLLSGQEARWYKGNTHCHTNNSDGDMYPRQVVRWYRDHNYNFPVITDHNLLTEVKFLDTDRNDDFLLIPGVEISDGFQGTPVHINALNTDRNIPPQGGESIVEALQNNIDAVNKAGAIPQVNHPNWLWSFAHDEISQLTGVCLFELYNLSYNCNNFGAGGYPGMEEVWDRILSRGIRMYGVAADDAHDYARGIEFRLSLPGTCWIMVRAEALTPKSILDAMTNGDFYSTTGVILKDIQISDTQYEVSIEPDNHMKYTTTFYGKGGKILAEVFGPEASYTFRGDELYVRARVFASSGEFACTQPHFLK